MPDEIFEQNRFFDRLKQEKILSEMLIAENFDKLYSLVSNAIGDETNFSALLDAIIKIQLPIFEKENYIKVEDEKKREELYNNLENRLLQIVDRYNQGKFHSLLEYQLWQMNKNKKYETKQDILDDIDKRYNIVFNQIRNMV